MHTATRGLLCALLLFQATERTASATEVRVEVAFDGKRASRALEVQALKEAALIWAPYGVEIGAAQPRGCESAAAVRLGVSFGSGPDRGMAAASLGSIRFLNGVPEPAIVLYPRAIAALLSATPGTFAVNAEGVLRDFIVGRVLGRALAHEVGHFLLRSQQHSSAGLMRALQPAADLVEPGRQRFALSADNVQRLAAMSSSLPHPSGALSCAD